MGVKDELEAQRRAEAEVARRAAAEATRRAEEEAARKREEEEARRRQANNTQTKTTHPTLEEEKKNIYSILNKGLKIQRRHFRLTDVDKKEFLDKTHAVFFLSKIP